MGLLFGAFQVGQTFQHGSFEVAQADNEAFCKLTHNNQPLHFDASAAKAAGFDDVLTNGIYTFAAAVGLSVPDLTEGTLVANLGYDEVRHPAPVYPGDTLAVASEVVATRESSKPGRGIVTIATAVANQQGVTVCTFRRVVMVRA